MDIVSSDELIYSEAFKVRLLAPCTRSSCSNAHSKPTAIPPQVLDALVDSNELSNDRADEAKKIYQDLHTAALKAMGSEKQRLDEAKVLKKRLEDDNEAKHSPPSQGDQSDLRSALQV